MPLPRGLIFRVPIAVAISFYLISPRQLFIIIFFFGQTECQLAQLKLISLDDGGLVMLGLDQVACSMADID